MVVDLQGMQGSDNNFVLTDPAIHSLDTKYGDGDLGVGGFIKFFETHR